MKKVLSGFVAMMLLLSFTLPALAAAQSPPLLQITSSPDRAGVSWTLTTDSGDFAISHASCDIEKASSTSVNASACTQTNQTADSIGGVIYLQKLVNGVWSSVNSKSFTAYGTNTSTGSITWSAEPGFYYRLRTNHTAAKDGSTLYKTTYTSSIFVN